MQPVLVVEDDPSTRDLLATYLAFDGLAVVTASNGVEALAKMREANPCLILLDLMMPVMDGEQFRRAQLREPSMAAVPVILVTAVHDAPQRAEQLKANGWVTKPFDPDQLLDVVHAYCPPR